jgi:hypothetical protein
METKQKRTRSHRGKPGKEEKMVAKRLDKEMQRKKMPPAPHPSPTLHSIIKLLSPFKKNIIIRFVSVKFAKV